MWSVRESTSASLCVSWSLLRVFLHTFAQIFGDLNYIIREESLACIWVISDSRWWFLAFSIFYYLPLRLPLQLAAAFENGWQKNIQPIPLTKTQHWKKGGIDFFSPKNPSVDTQVKRSVRIISPRRRWLIPPEAFGARSTVSGGGDFEGRPSSQWQCRSGTFRCRESRGGVVVVETRGFWWKVKGGEGEVLCCVFGLGGSDGW